MIPDIKDFQIVYEIIRTDNWYVSKRNQDIPLGDGSMLPVRSFLIRDETEDWTWDANHAHPFTLFRDAYLALLKWVSYVPLS